MHIDNEALVEIPEGIDLRAELAGPVIRANAFAIDMLVKIVMGACLVFVVSMLGTAGTGVYLIGYFFLEWLYPVFFEVWMSGQTPGKRTFDLQVVNDDLTPVNWETSLIRNLLRAVDFMPFAYMIGFCCMCFNTQFKRLGDITAGTIVIHKRDHRKLTVPADSKPVILPYSLEHNEQLAFLDFLYRSNDFSDARKQELAMIIAEATNSNELNAVQNANRIAAGILKRQ